MIPATRMKTTTPDPAPAAEWPTRLLRRAAPVVAVAAAGTALVWWAAGNSLGLWLGGFAVAAAVAPAAALRHRRVREQILTAGASADPAVGVWLIAALLTGVSPWSWLACAVLLYAFAAAGAGMAAGLRAIRLPAGLAMAITAIALFAWLAAPVWLAGHLGDRGIDRLAAHHPLIAANGQLLDLGVWLEHGLVYRHTVMGQDVAYAIPETVWPSALLHAGIAAVGFLAAALLARRGGVPREEA